MRTRSQSGSRRSSGREGRGMLRPYSPGVPCWCVARPRCPSSASCGATSRARPGPSTGSGARSRGSLSLYEAGRSYARANGIIIADTKFEFGTTATGELLVIDEILTPDSSRFWPADRYRPGKSQPSFDKQPLRDYLADLKKQERWNGNPPPPPLPPEVVRATSERYLDAYRRLTGKALEVRA